MNTCLRFKLLITYCFGDFPQQSLSTIYFLDHAITYTWVADVTCRPS